MANRFLSNIRINDAYTFPASDGTAGQVIGTDGAGNLSFVDQQGADGATLIYLDTFTGDGVTTDFTLSQNVDNEIKTFVYFDGVYQEKDTYEVSTTTITFSTAPPSGTSMEVVIFLSVAAEDYNQKLLFYGKATGAISKGDAVMFAGAEGDHFLFARATQAAIEADHELFIGLANQNFANNEFGYVVEFGRIDQIDTTVYTSTAGATLWFDSTGTVAGAITETEPTPPAAKIQVAAVIRLHQNEGSLFVRPTWYHELGELHDVDITSAVDKDLLTYNSSTGVWENSKTLGDITTGNITTSGAVDGVDISDFKTAYDSHNHDDRYYTETEIDTLLTNSTNWDTAYSWGDHAGLYSLLGHTHTESEITDFGNYVTGITHDTVNTKLVITNRDTTTVDLSLAQYVDDTNLARLVSGTVNISTGIATFTRDDATTFDVDFSALLDDTNDYVTSASFNTSDGVLTLTRFGGATVTVDLDGKYEEAITASTNISLNKLTATNIDVRGESIQGGDLNAVGRGFYYWGSTQPATGSPGDNYMMSLTTTDTGQNIQLAFGGSGNGKIFVRRADSGTYYNWTEFWSDSHFSSTDISNWNTAYGWGNHASAGYQLASSGFFKPFSELGSAVNLNDFRTTGYASQNTNSNAAAGSNYPTPYAGMFEVINDDTGNGVHTLQRYARYASNDCYTRYYYNGNWTSWTRFLTTSDEGSGNGLDADTVDGIQASQFLRSDANDTTSGNLTISKSTPRLSLYDSEGITSTKPSIEFDGTYTQGVAIQLNVFDGELPAAGYGLVIGPSSTNTQWPSTGDLSFSVLGEIYAGSESLGSVNKVWHAGNDGSGSGLDADLLDGQHASSFAASSHTHTWANILGETSNSVNDWGGLRHQTNDGYIDFGPANSSWAHIYTDRAAFYFNSPLVVNNVSTINTNDIRSKIFYDSDDTGYYINPASTSNLSKLHIGSAASLGDGTDPDISTTLLYSTSKVVTPKLVFVNDANGDDNYITCNDTNTAYAINGQSMAAWFEFTGDKAAANGNNSGGIVASGLLSAHGSFSQSLTLGGNTVLTTANEGSGNGLDADTLDGIEAFSLLRNDAEVAGWVPAYSNADPDTVRWNETEQAMELQSSTDSSIGAAFRAVRAKAGDKVKFSVTLKGSTATVGGMYLRIYYYAGNLPNGKTHVSNSASYGLVQEDTDGDTGWYENNDVPGTWTNFYRTFTMPADGYVSLVTLNWTNHGTNSIYYKTPDIQFEKVNDSTLWDGNQFSSYLDQALLTTSSPSFASPTFTSINLAGYMYHNGDTNTYMVFTGDRIQFVAGGVQMIDMTEGTTDYIDFANNTARITSGGSFECTGDIIAYTTTSLSDERQKENIKKIDSPIEKIKQINGYTFDWKHNGASSGGVIAQEVEKVFPEIVKEKSIMDSEPHKTIEYNGLVGLLIETVKELSSEVQELKNKLNGTN